LEELWFEDVGDKNNFIVVVSFPLDPCERTLKPNMPLRPLSQHIVNYGFHNSIHKP